MEQQQWAQVVQSATRAPSIHNTQPWRFVVARRGTEAFDRVVGSLAEFNQQWAPNASVLILAIAETVHCWLSALSGLDSARRARVAAYAEKIAADRVGGEQAGWGA